MRCDSCDSECDCEPASVDDKLACLEHGVLFIAVEVCEGDEVVCDVQEFRAV